MVLRYCVIGYPIGHSLSPKLYNAAFKKCGISAWYEAISVGPQDLGYFMRKFRRDYNGANVTIPHKEKVMEFLDEISPEAEAVGAANVVVKRGEKLIGYNTDVFGFMEALRGCRGGIFLKNKKAFILGAGGAARAVVYGLKKAGVLVAILNRTLSRAEKLGREFGCNYGGTSDFNGSKCDILVNATSVGMYRNDGGYGTETPLPELRAALKLVKRKPVVMDIVYRPCMTKFLRDAKASGCRIVTGDKMFLAQAKKSFELFTGKEFPAISFLRNPNP